jgi:5-methylcytosine-specific restriction endonuclease McrA
MDTLVLSATYEPVGSIDWREAITLWVAGRVEILENHVDRFVHTVSTAFPMPAVIRYLRGRTRRVTTLRFNRDNVFLRDRGECQYCGRTMQRHESTYDHVVPRRYNGQTTWENIVLACRPCNQRKGGRTPDQAGMPLRTKPVRPRAPHPAQRIAHELRNVPATWSVWLGEAAE